jgi:hypothetical protein
MVIKGLIDTASWLVFIDEDYETVEYYLKRFSGSEVTSRDLSFYSFLTLQHETMHFWHAISTPFLFFYSCDHLGLCLRAVDAFARSKKRYSDIPPDGFGFSQEEFKKLAARLQLSDAAKGDWLERAEAKLRSGSWHRWERTEPTPSFTNAVQVIEGCAVLCAYRLCHPRPSHEDFLSHLDRHYSGEFLVTYGDAYLLATSILGELAFDLFAPACYLALQAENPGHNFAAILSYAKERAKSVSLEQIIEDPLTFLLDAINAREDHSFSLTMKRAMSQGARVPFHPILQPYVERIAQAADDLRVCDFFARPYFYRHYSAGGTMQAKLKEFLVDMLPPAHVYKSNVTRCLRTGLGIRLGDEYTQTIVDITAIIGLAERLFAVPNDKEMRDKKMRCSHDNCPVHETRLCEEYFAYPDNDFRRCQFPVLLKDLKLQSLLESIPRINLLLTT